MPVEVILADGFIQGDIKEVTFGYMSVGVGRMSCILLKDASAVDIWDQTL